MNFENPTPAPEKEPRFPSLEEIRYQIQLFVEKAGLKNSRELRILAQGKDIYHYELVATDDQGDDFVYMYKKRGAYPDSQALVTRLEVTYYIGSVQTNMACGGENLADYDETTGNWILTE